MGTIIISLILIVIVAIVIASMIKDKRNGRHPSCGGSCGSCHCASCAGKSACHQYSTSK
ncbi:MAG: FeoB-associated Cys-rich membrane protein [Treponema sp.]|nr:FeoB-associated Cys-rich membrane protein [Treponema sp.]